MRIAIDLMGSDNSPEVLLKACLEEEKHIANIKFVFIGTKEIEPLAKKEKASFVKAKSTITMEENPLLALRQKKDSSIFLGMKLLKEKKVDAFISAGNTGALMSSAKLNLSMLPKITRPILLALVPSKKKPIAVLDVGANITSKTKYLCECALLGSSFQKTQGRKKIIVGLLNIGSEAKKGTSEIKKAYKELKTLSKKTPLFEFIGNIEGKEVFEGFIDVLVTDGFTGNIFLKTAEGLVNFILDRLIECGDRCENIKPYFADLTQYLHYEKYPGALLCGIDRIVIKCHSYCSPHSFVNAIKGSINFIEQDIVNSIKKLLST